MADEAGLTLTGMSMTIEDGDVCGYCGVFIPAGDASPHWDANGRCYKRLVDEVQAP